jgi:hypothetical protein
MIAKIGAASLSKQWRSLKNSADYAIRLLKAFRPSDPRATAFPASGNENKGFLRSDQSISEVI